MRYNILTALILLNLFSFMVQLVCLCRFGCVGYLGWELLCLFLTDTFTLKLFGFALNLISFLIQSLFDSFQGSLLFQCLIHGFVIYFRRLEWLFQLPISRIGRHQVCLSLASAHPIFTCTPAHKAGASRYLKTVLSPHLASYTTCQGIDGS